MDYSESSTDKGSVWGELLIKKTKVLCLVSFLFLEIKIEPQLLQSQEIY